MKSQRYSDASMRAGSVVDYVADVSKQLTTAVKRSVTVAASAVRARAHVILVGWLGVAVLTGRAAAIHGRIDCPLPPGWEPFFQFIHKVTDIAVLFGVVLALLALVVGAIFIIHPDRALTDRGLQIVKHAVYGLILVFIARLVVGFVIGQLGGIVCV